MSSVGMALDSVIIGARQFCCLDSDLERICVCTGMEQLIRQISQRLVPTKFFLRSDELYHSKIKVSKCHYCIN